MRIPVSYYKGSYKLEEFTLVSVKEDLELKIESSGIKWPSLTIDYLLGDNHSFSIDMICPRFINYKGGLIKNYVIDSNYPTYEAQPGAYKKVVQSFAMIVIDLFTHSTNFYGEPTKVILDLAGHFRLILDRSPLGCPACSQNDNVVLQSSLSKEDRDLVESKSFEEIKFWLTEAGYSLNISDGGFSIKDYDAICDVYDLFLRKIQEVEDEKN